MPPAGSPLSFAWDTGLDGQFSPGGSSVYLTRASEDDYFFAAVQVTDIAGNSGEWLISFVVAGGGNVQSAATANNYAQLYKAETAPLPEGWEVHHKYQQAMADRILKEKGINVHDSKHLFAVHPKIHHLISAEQTRWWWRKAAELRNPLTTPADWQRLYKQVNLDEYMSFCEELQSSFSDDLYKVGTTAAEFAAAKKKTTARYIANLIADAPNRSRLLGSAVGALAVLGVFYKAFKGMRDIANPNDQQKAALAMFMNQYQSCADIISRNKSINVEDIVDLKNSAKALALAFEADEGTVNLIDKQAEEWIRLHGAEYQILS